MFSELAEEVMVLAASYSSSVTPEMRRRKHALDEMAAIVRTWLPAWSAAETLALAMNAEGGGQVGSVSPTAWLRVFSKTLSPSATRGLYAVYLFDALGSSVYLSLNMGTSVFRKGYWRATGDADALARKADWLRLGLDRAGTDLRWADDEAMDLGVASLLASGAIKSSDPVTRARNYEAGSIASRRYHLGRVPADHEMQSDLFACLWTWASLENDVLAP